MKCSVTACYYGWNELTQGDVKTVFTAFTNRRLSSCLESTASGSHATALQFPSLALHLSDTADTFVAFQMDYIYCNILKTENALPLAEYH